jgi:hypothetical protein
MNVKLMLYFKTLRRILDLSFSPLLLSCSHFLTLILVAIIPTRKKVRPDYITDSMLLVNSLFRLLYQLNLSF